MEIRQLQPHRAEFRDTVSIRTGSSAQAVFSCEFHCRPVHSRRTAGVRDLDRIQKRQIFLHFRFGPAETQRGIRMGKGDKSPLIPQPPENLQRLDILRDLLLYENCQDLCLCGQDLFPDDHKIRIHLLEPHPFRDRVMVGKDQLPEPDLLCPAIEILPFGKRIPGCDAVYMKIRFDQSAHFSTLFKTALPAGKSIRRHSRSAFHIPFGKVKKLYRASAPAVTSGISSRRTIKSGMICFFCRSPAA